MLKNKIRKEGPRKNLHSDEELQFDLELDLNQSITPSTQKKRQDMRSDRRDTDGDNEQPPLILKSNFYTNLVIPPDFFDSPEGTPRDTDKFDHRLSEDEYLNFPIFIRKVLYPELKNLTICDAKLDRSELSSDKIVEIESYLIELNYKNLLKLYEIAEKVELYAELMKQTHNPYCSNPFFKECKMFMKRHDAIFYHAFCRKSKELENIRVKCYRLLKAGNVVEQFILALKETLVLMGEDSDLECADVDDCESMLLIKENNFLNLYGYHAPIETEGEVSEYFIPNMFETREEALLVPNHKKN
jgi:hypothetical protein